MLRRLRIENLVLIREAELELAPGLNAITGETGAGKTILAQAVGLLLGTKGGEAFVGPVRAASAGQAVVPARGARPLLRRRAAAAARPGARRVARADSGATAARGPERERGGGRGAPRRAARAGRGHGRPRT